MDRYEDTKLRVKEATDLVALIESYLPLRPRGRTLVALCPFHAENTPSFTVHREAQFFKCYGCGKAGDVFTWLMERDGLSFREAMEVLAERASISLEGVFQQPAGGDSGPKARDAYQALAAVAEFCHRALLTPAGQPARDYVAGRGLDDAMAPWQLGFHPEDGSLQRFARQHELPRDVLEQAGLLRNGRELFAGRLMFPIVDERGRTVGFGGRVVPGTKSAEPRGDYNPPKYLNSPESPFFRKRRVLYGLQRAKQAGERRLVVMEGYTDVIACHLAGFCGAVASLGTAFTAEHARTVERYADRGVVLMFDGDRAGTQAAERAMRELVNSRLSVRIALVGDEHEGCKDPADVVLGRPGEDDETVAERRHRFADEIDGADEALAVWFRLLRRRLDLSQAVDVERAARECAGLLDLVEVPVRRAAYLEQMARYLAVPAPALQRLLSRSRRQPAAAEHPASAAGESDHGQPSAAAASKSPGLMARSEVELLACVLAQPALFSQLDFDQAPIETGAIATLFAWAGEGLALGRDSTDQLVRYLFSRAAEQQLLQQALIEAHDRAANMPSPDEVLRGLIEGRQRLASESIRRRLRLQLQQAMAAGDRAAAAELQAELLQLMRRVRPREKALAKTGSVTPSPAPPAAFGRVASPPSAGSTQFPPGPESEGSA